MPDSLLTVLRLLLLSLIWLFFVRVLMLLASKPRTAAAGPVATPTPAARPAAAAPAPRASSVANASLRVVSAGDYAHAEFSVGDEATLGRGAGCQVQFNDPMVSQLHARLFRSNQGLQIEDLGSTNGTYVNGKKVGAPTRLKKGDRVRVGPIELEVIG